MAYLFPMFCAASKSGRSGRRLGARHSAEVWGVVATTEASALPVLSCRFVRVPRAPVIVLSVATPDRQVPRRRQGSLRRLLLRQADLCRVGISTSQVQLTSELLGIEPRRVLFHPFGVDVDFFQPADGSREWDFVSWLERRKGLPDACRVASCRFVLSIVTSGRTNRPRWRRRQRALWWSSHTSRSTS